MQHITLAVFLELGLPTKFSFEHTAHPVGCITEVPEGICHMFLTLRPEKNSGNVWTTIDYCYL
jgi:hypothetical protein